jgi:undecaprenyl-diphosphatase
MTAQNANPANANMRWDEVVRANFAAGIGWLLRKPKPVFLQREAIGLPRRLAVIAVIVFAAFWQMALFDGAATRGALLLPKMVAAFFNFVTDFGKSGWFLFPLAAVIVAIALASGPHLRRMTQSVLAAIAVRCLFLVAAIGLPSLFVTIVKRVIGRARPIVGEFDPFAYVPLGWRADYASMPSGHATTAFAAAFAIAALWPRLAPAMCIYALLIAVSRVVVLAHYWSDVVVGGAIGFIGAFLVREYFADRGLVFAMTPAGAIVPKPGPSWRRIKAIARRVTGQ